MYRRKSKSSETRKEGRIREKPMSHSASWNFCNFSGEQQKGLVFWFRGFRDLGEKKGKRS